MRSFGLLSALFVAFNGVQGLDISGDYVCTSGSECQGAVLDVASGSAFSLKCKDAGSCTGSHIIVHSDCTLNPGGIECTTQFSCMDSTIVVYNSDLATDADNYLDCENGSTGGLCMRMNLTLVDSHIALFCGSNDCDYMEVYLFASTLELKADTVFSTTTSKRTIIYLYDVWQLIDNGVHGYKLEFMTKPTTPKPSTPKPTTLKQTTPEPSTPKPTTPRPTTPAPTTPVPTTPKPTTSKPTTPAPTTPVPTNPVPTTPGPSTSTLIPTVTHIPNSTISHTSVSQTTNKSGTQTTTTALSTANPSGGEGNGGSNAISKALLFAAIGGGVVLLALVCGIHIGIKYSDSRKQEQGGDEKDAKVQIALVSRTQSQASGQQHEDSGNAAHGPKWVVSEEKVDEHTTEGQTADGNPDAVPSPEVSLEIMYCEMPKNHTPGGYLPHSPEGCRRQVEGGAYGTP